MAFEPKPNIYTFLNERLILTDQDRESLKTKRGFTDNTINTLQFKSARKENEKAIEDTIRTFGLGDCFTCGVVDRDGKPAWQFTNEGLIIIPYLDDIGQGVLFYKSHKFGGLTDSGVFPYSLYTLLPRQGHQNDLVVICESEFKAAAMWQMGWRSLGLGGVASFAGEHIDKLQGIFKDASLAIILFDTEIQDDPACANYKEDFRRRYAQHIWSYNMAKRIKNILGVDTKIATLPEAWMIDNKSDIDGAVAAGHTRDEFELVLRRAVTPDYYRYNLKIPKEHQPWVNRKMEWAYKTNIIFEKNNCYYMQRKVGEKVIQQELSNFIINIKNQIEIDGNLHREVQLISKFQDISAPFTASPKQWASASDFAELALGKGDFFWKGSTKEGAWKMVTDYLSLENDGMVIKRLDYVGRNEEHKHWIFENMLIKDDGTIIKPDKDKNFWDGEKGYRILQIGSGIPSLSEEPINIDEVLNKFYEAWGISGVLGFTFSIASLFANPVFDLPNNKAFPLAMLYGEKQSGKSALSDVMYLLQGHSANQAAYSIAVSSPVGIDRSLSYYGSLMVRLDEYRTDEHKTKAKEANLRSAYNRQFSLKGVKEKHGVREVRLKATIMLIGEEKPDDPAMLDRIIPIYLSVKDKSQKSLKALQWLYELGNKLSYITYYVLKDYQKNVKRFVQDVQDTFKGLGFKVEESRDFRTQHHYSILMATLGILLPKEKAIVYIEKFFNSFIANLKQKGDGSLLNTFFMDIHTMKVMGEKVENFMNVDKQDQSIVFFYLPGIYSLWSKYKAQHGGTKSLYTEKTIREYMGSQEYYIGTSRKSILSTKERVRCLVFDLDKGAPAILKDIYTRIAPLPEGELYDESSKIDP